MKTTTVIAIILLLGLSSCGGDSVPLPIPVQSNISITATTSNTIDVNIIVRADICCKSKSVALRMVALDLVRLADEINDAPKIETGTERAEK